MNGQDMVNHFQHLKHEKHEIKTSVHESRCPYCSVQCTMNVHIEKEQHHQAKYIIEGNKADPVTEGRLCVKGLTAHQPAIDERRVKKPLVRLENGLEPIEWGHAYTEIAAKIKMIQQKYGDDAMGCYGSGALTNEKTYLFGKFARLALHTPFIDYNGRYCMSAAAAGSIQAFGVDRGMPFPLEDVPFADVIILAGTNLAECQPTIMQYFRKMKQNGGKIIVIDPRETATCSLADMHLQVRPGYDAALVNGMLKVLLNEGYMNREFVEQRTIGFEELKQHLEHVSLREVEQLTNVSLEQIRAAARLFGGASNAMVLTARGVEQHASGVQNVRNFINLVLLTGKIGRQGSGYGAITGQANGQGGREHGQKADQLPGYRLIENPEHRAHVANVWGVDPTYLPGKGVSAYELFEKIDRGEIKGLIVLASNPVVSSPNSHLIERALRKLELLVCIDLYENETSEAAHYLLPGSSHMEDTGTMTQLEGRVVLRRAMKKLPGKAKMDGTILCELAEHLGAGKWFQYTSNEEVFNELRRATAGGIADYAGISYERLEKGEALFWPCPSEDHPGTPRLFETSFWHADGKARFGVVEHQSPKENREMRYPYLLTTGRVLQHYNAGVLTRMSSELNARVPEPLLEIHPDAASEIGLLNGGYANVQSRRGSIVLKVKLSKKIRSDTVFVGFHWGSEKCINRLTNPMLDPTCRMPEFKACAVRITPAKGVR